MANLNGQNIGTNYKGILNLGSAINSALSGTLQAVTDGDGVASPLRLRTTNIDVGTFVHFGGDGTTGTFPALKRINAGLDFRLDNDTDFTDVTAKSIRVKRVADTFAYLELSTSGNDAVATFGNSNGDLATFKFDIQKKLSMNRGVYINTTEDGFLPPRLTTTQKNAISSPAAGLVVYDTTLNKLCVYTTAWETITSV